MADRLDFKRGQIDGAPMAGVTKTADILVYRGVIVIVVGKSNDSPSSYV